MAIKNSFSSTGSLAKHAVIIAALAAMSALLGSCGGGGAESTAVVAPPVAVPLAVLPAAADVFADVPTDFTVSGGTPPYTAGTGNAVVVPAPTVSGSASSGYKFTVLAKNVVADTPVSITIRDNVGATAPLALSVRATTLNNSVTITPVAPTGTGCSGVCSGGDAVIGVSAILNGIKLTNRPIRFNVINGDYRFVTPGTNVLTTSIITNTDENGNASVLIRVIVTAPTQTATVSITDTVSGLTIKTNFVIAQVTSGLNILSILPSGSVTFTAGKAAAGQPAQCPFGGVVDHYIYGGTPPYTAVSPLPQYLNVFPSVVTTNGGSYRVTQSGCGTASIIVTDAQNRVIESSSVIGAPGPAGDAIPPATVVPNAIAVSPTSLTIGCGETGTVNITGSGPFTANVSTAGVPSGAFTITPTSGTIPGTMSFRRNTGISTPSPATILVNVVGGAGTSVVPVTITATPTFCP